MVVYMKQNKIAVVHMKGMLSVWIIYLLKKKSMTGYQILHEISQITGDTWHPTTGSVYPALHKMKKNGIITAKKVGTRGKIVYTLTPHGKEIYENMRKHVATIMGNTKFLRVFDSLLWPDETEEFRNEVESIYTALIDVRNNIKKSDYKRIAAKLSSIRRQIEKMK